MVAFDEFQVVWLELGLGAERSAVMKVNEGADPPPTLSLIVHPSTRSHRRRRLRPAQDEWRGEASTGKYCPVSFDGL